MAAKYVIPRQGTSKQQITVTAFISNQHSIAHSAQLDNQTVIITLYIWALHKNHNNTSQMHLIGSQQLGACTYTQWVAQCQAMPVQLMCSAASSEQLAEYHAASQWRGLG